MSVLTESEICFAILSLQNGICLHFPRVLDNAGIIYLFKVSEKETRNRRTLFKREREAQRKRESSVGLRVGRGAQASALYMEKERKVSRDQKQAGIN